MQFDDIVRQGEFENFSQVERRCDFRLQVPAGQGEAEAMLDVVFLGTIVGQLRHALDFGKIGDQLLQFGQAIYRRVIHVPSILES